MASLAIQIGQMVDALPDEDQKLVENLVSKLLLAWDPDYTKLTPSERASLEEAEAGEFEDEETVFKELGIE